MAPVVGKVYVHSKSGNKYKVIALAKMESNPNGEYYVIYERTDRDSTSDYIWIRPFSEWDEPVELVIPRFRADTTAVSLNADIPF